MAASTISRATWTDGASPTGTLINNARLQADVYDKVDTLLANNITFGGVVNAEGFGSHTFSSSGTGAARFVIRNTSAGTTNIAALNAGNDGSTVAGEFGATSSTYTAAGAYQQNSAFCVSNVAGGLSLAAASSTSATVRTYISTTEIHRASLESSLPTLSIQVSNQLGARLAISNISSADAPAFVQSGEPGVAATNVIVANNYRGSTSGASARVNTSTAGSFFRLQANALEFVGVSAAGALSTRFSVDTSGHFLPGADDTYNLGSSSLAWNRLFLADGSGSSPSVTFGGDTNTGMYRNGADEVGIACGGSGILTVTTGGIGVAGTVNIVSTANCAGLTPNTDDLYDLGSVVERWDDVYATNGTIQTSDRALKRDITPSPLGLAFLQQLAPVAYRWNSETRKGSGRLHLGLIAQDVLAVDPSLTNYGIVTGDGTARNRYGMRYTELIAPLIAAVQELAARLQAVETR